MVASFGRSDAVAPVPVVVGQCRRIRDSAVRVRAPENERLPNLQGAAPRSFPPAAPAAYLPAVEHESPRLHVIAQEVLEAGAEAARITPVADLFARVWSVVPEAQDVVSVEPDETVGNALALMTEHGYSQLPVGTAAASLGFFSYRSFATEASAVVQRMPAKTSLTELPVEQFTRSATFLSPHAELTELFDVLETEDFVFVGEQPRVDGVVTTVDALTWLHDLADPFVRFREIERSLREIVSRKLSPDQIEHCARRVFADKYQERPDALPTALHRMTLDELRLLVISGHNWPLIEPALGTNSVVAKSHLKDLPRLRNDVFHFRRELDPADRELIVSASVWLLRRLQILEGDT